MPKFITQGELEVDPERGVLYFHSNKTGTTILRICRIPFKAFKENDCLDITHMKGASFFYAYDAKKGGKDVEKN